MRNNAEARNSSSEGPNEDTEESKAQQLEQLAHDLESDVTKPAEVRLMATLLLRSVEIEASLAKTNALLDVVIREIDSSHGDD